MKKTQVKPIEVSEIKPNYARGRISSWYFDVRYAGDLALWHDDPLPRNLSEYRQFLQKNDLTIDEDNIERDFFEFRKNMGVAYDFNVTYVLNPAFKIPKRNNLSTVKWDEKSKNGDDKYSNTVVGYVFLRGLFGRGVNRAERFRQKLLSEINENSR